MICLLRCRLDLHDLIVKRMIHEFTFYGCFFWGLVVCFDHSYFCLVSVSDYFYRMG
ncbi:hypothetical protein HAT2_00671 [Candidatus Similichlamydia laticola]|uniref:Uncharacterized protein n=1 Tax=Candidatus Similichlamydia laticola TaxID=2170265 RepID=A0A369K9C8_9BACT|nr:hypothetical protein HAT2_00671 [Candidatus Similichlamydia laticola]